MDQVIFMTGVGSYLPKDKISNEDLSKFVNTSDEWIKQRSGIEYRHFVSKDELTSDMATNASKKALQNSKLTPSDIDLVVLATTTPDCTFPSTATKVQKNLGTKGIAFDIQAVCAGFIYAISVATSMLRDNIAEKCLVIGADSMSKILDFNDRTTSVLFGDGAGAVVLEKLNINGNLQTEGNWGILSNVIYSDGSFYDLLYTDGGVSSTKTTGTIRMQGKEVFKHAVEKLSKSFMDSLKKTNFSIQDIDWIVPHQANQRIINAVADKVGISHDKIVSTIAKHGNTSAASIPLALDDYHDKNLIKNGDLIGLQAIGGGLAWGASIVRFGKPEK